MLTIFPHHFLLGQNQSQITNKINWLESASKLSPKPSLIQSAFILLPCLLVSSTALVPTGIQYLHIFIYLLPHSLFSLNNLLHSLFSPLPTTALSANNLKFLCYRGDTEGCSPHYYPPNLTWFITPLIESDQKPIESQSNICISPSSVWFNCRFCQSRFCCCLPEPCHSSLPRNLVSRFTVLQLLMTKRVPGSPSGAFNAKAFKVIQEYQAGICWNNGLYCMSLKQTMCILCQNTKRGVLLLSQTWNVWQKLPRTCRKMYSK